MLLLVSLIGTLQFLAGCGNQKLYATGGNSSFSTAANPSPSPGPSPAGSPGPSPTPLPSASPYNLQNSNSGLCMKANGSNVVQDVCSTQSLQIVENVSGAGIQLQIQNTNLCITSATQTLADINGVTLATCDSLNHQIYVPTTYSTNLRSFNLYGTGLCFDIIYSSKSGGDAVINYTCSGTVQQKFLAIPASKTVLAVPVSSTSVYMKVNLSGLCLQKVDVAPSTSGVVNHPILAQATCSSATSMLFQQLLYPNGSYQFREQGTQQCLTAIADNTSLNGAMGLTGCASDNSQFFNLNVLSASNYQVKDVNSGLCFAQNPTTNNLEQWTCGNYTNQSYSFPTVVP